MSDSTLRTGARVSFSDRAVTASASGLDYSLTPSAALWQAPRVAKARQLSVEQVTQLVNEATQKPLLSFLGQPVVNILQLNMSLDALKDK